MRSRLSHGATLGTTLLVAALILLLGLTAASTGIFHLSFGTRVSRGTQAVEVADAAIALCLERLLTEDGFGEGDDPAHTVEVTLGDSVGRCTFSSAQASALEVPRSLDNRSEEGAREGWGGRVVPPRSLQLIAVGESGGVQRTVEVVAHLPKFPYAIAASGEISSRGDLLVGSIDKPEDLVGGLTAEELHPADLLSNASGVAIDLDGEEVRISGNLESVGAIELGQAVKVEGEVRPNASATDLPDIDLEEFLSRPGRHLSQADLNSSLTIWGSRKWLDRKMDVRGGLTLDEGVLLVDGDLEIRGGLTGKGAIVARGSVTIHDGAALSSTDQVAVLAGGDIIVHGNDRGEERGSYFQGTLYTEGSLEATDVTLMGLFLANGERTGISSPGELKLQNARVLGWENATEIVVKKLYIEFNLSNGQGDDDFQISGGRGPTANINFTLEPTIDQLNQINNLINDRLTNEDGAISISEMVPLLVESGLTMDGEYLELPANVDDWGVLNVIANKMTDADLTPKRREAALISSEYIFEFDLNKFLRDSDRIRIMLWEQH